MNTFGTENEPFEGELVGDFEVNKSNQILSLDESTIEGFGLQSEVEERLDQIVNFYSKLDKDVIMEFLNGTRLVAVPAVTTVLLGVDKILGQLEPEFEILETKNDREQNK